VEIALDGKPDDAGESCDLGKADVAEHREALPRIAQTEGAILIVRVDLGEEPGGMGIRGEEFDDRLEIERLVLPVGGRALCATVLEGLLSLRESNELHRG
jgi:hypothetical protein